MDVETARDYCLSKPFVTECLPFDDVSLVFKVMGRMFALLDLEGADRLCLKCEPERAVDLRDRYAGIEPAYHFNKRHWNQILFGTDVPDSLVRALIDHSYDEVLKKISRKRRELFIRQQAEKKEE